MEEVERRNIRDDEVLVKEILQVCTNVDGIFCQTSRLYFFYKNYLLVDSSVKFSPA